MKYVSIDIETTGLDWDRDQILQFGAVIDDTNPASVLAQRSVEELPSFQKTILWDRIEGNPFAINMNASIIAQIARGEGISIDSLSSRFQEFLLANGFEKLSDRITFNVAGKNFSGFDLRFLERLDHWNLYFRPSHRVLDPATGFALPGDTSVPNLETCLRRAGINKTVSHEALSDARDVVSCLRFLLTSPR